ncbi:osteopetrosis-associated transmembrane protein 1 [Patella vulgata]|uniref:osteopetrosis-associated transmembrane protein 1 n=1 Tax=Patella vulgata TaxID=6465 RepID=UPI00217F28F8|nr:osteopetrosis-associated transmembrane protein 1 [Patella vulgata]
MYGFLQFLCLILLQVVASYDGQYYDDQSSLTGGTVWSDEADNSSSSIMDSCQANLIYFAESASNFTNCLVMNSRPFRLCEGCVIPYKKATEIYQALFDKKGDDCHDKLLRSDRIQALTLVNKNMEDVWNNADCESCFESIDEDKETGNVNFTLTKDTVLFRRYYDTFRQCLNATPGADIPLLLKNGINKTNVSACIVCKQNYSSLNAHYETIVSQTFQRVCMDIIDMMNYSRLTWGNDLQCSHRHGDLGPILGITFVMCMLPAIFYISNRIFGAAQEKSIVTQKRLKMPVKDYGSRQEQNLSSNSSSS